MLTTVSCGSTSSQCVASWVDAMLRLSNSAHGVAQITSCASSFVCDYVTRQKLGGSNMNFFVLKQLPLLGPDQYVTRCTWDYGNLVRDWLVPRVLELTYTAWDLEPFARDLGYDGSPFRWDPERRFLLRCELDAAFFHLYGIERGDVDYIMETFPIVKDKDEAAHGEYRTKRVILEIYDQMAQAAETGETYRTRLNPPPVNLGSGRTGTVAPLHRQDERRAHMKHSEPETEESPAFDTAAEEKFTHAPYPPESAIPQLEESANGVDTPTPREGSGYTSDVLERLARSEHDEAASDGHAIPDAPNPHDATLALHACVPDGEKVERDALLADAARKLGYPNLTRNVRRALNKALSTENNAGRLRTDWERVWRPRR
jgi:hypothetical protein